MIGAVSASVRDELMRTPRPAECLGVSAGALYLLTRSGAVLAVVTHDAVRLPCAVVLTTTSAERPLTSTFDRDFGQFTVGSGHIACTLRRAANDPRAPTVIGVARAWRTPRVSVSDRPHPKDVSELRARVDEHDLGVDRTAVAALAVANDASSQVCAGMRLLGRGPGLTPSGDDVLAGFLIGRVAWGGSMAGVRRIVETVAPNRTTALSAQLLRHAIRGECCPQVAAVVNRLGHRRPSDGTTDDLLALGHTSGPALAWGLIAAVSAPAAEGGIGQ
jgi:hypothetical protein